MSVYEEFVRRAYLTKKVDPELSDAEIKHNINEIVLWILHSSEACYKLQKAIEKRLDAFKPKLTTRGLIKDHFNPLVAMGRREYRAAIDPTLRVSPEDVAWELAGQYLEGHRRGK